MTAIVFGIITACLWATSTLCSSRSVRMIGQFSVVAWAMLVGLIVTLPVAAASGVPEGLTTTAVVGLAAAGAAVVGGLLLAYAALRVGKVAVVAPIMATEGAVAAAISAVAGESIGAVSAMALAIVVLGVVVAAIAPDPVPISDERPVRAVLLASAGALLFGFALFMTGRQSADLPLVWVLIPPRAVGTLLLFLPLVLMRRLRITRAALPLVIATGVAEVLGYLTFGLGARDSIATVAVLSSQFGTFAVIAAWLLFKERVGRLQLVGIGLLVVGVTTLAAASV